MTNAKRKFKLGGRALMLYSDLFDADLMTDLEEHPSRLYQILAVCRVPSTRESYEKYIKSEEFDNLLVNGELMEAVNAIKEDYAGLTEKLEDK